MGGAGPPLPLPDKPSIAVLPFANMSGDPEQEYFVDGMVEEIITALSRIRWLFVIARNSTFTYKGRPVDAKEVGRELGVRYVLEGSVRKAGQRVRITGQLIDALTGTHLWADRFDGSLEDVFELQDRVALSVAGVIEPALQAAEMRRSAGRSTTDLSAYDLYLRALAAFSTMAKEPVFEALGLLEQAIAIDRHYGPALSLAALCYLRLVYDGWAEEPKTNRGKGINLARQAIEVGENDPDVLANAAFVLAICGEDIGAMMGLVDRALALNPSFARGWFVSGLLRLFAGQHDLAIEHLETALRLSPRGRMGQPLTAIGTAFFFKRRFAEAEAAGHSGQSRLSHLIPHSRFVLCPYDLDSDEMLLFALVRAVEIAGEAASQVTAETRAQLPDLPWSSIVGMRNRLVHAYFDVNRDILRTTVTEAAPPLAERLNIVLSQG